jgi:hypothetical protein
MNDDKAYLTGSSDDPWDMKAFIEAPKVTPIPSRPISTDETVAGITAGYMVSVDGNTAPKKVHASLEDAKQEAERISKAQNGKTIRVLLLVGVYEPSHTWKEMV